MKTNQQLNNHEDTCVCNACLPFDMEPRETRDWKAEWEELDVQLRQPMDFSDEEQIELPF